MISTKKNIMEKKNSERFSGIKFAAAAMVALVVFFASMQISSAYEYNAESTVKVGISYGSSAVSTAELECGNGFIIAEYDDEGFEEIDSYDGGEMSVAYSDGDFVVYDEDGDEFGSFGSSLLLLPSDYDDDGYISYSGAKYRGGFVFTSNSNGSINVINYISVEDYLCGVVSGEMGYYNPLEALKAQAVSARSFAVNGKGRHKSYGFDVCTGGHCQTYKGMAAEYDETTKAVNDTHGEVMTHGGKVVSGYYSSYSPGFTEDAKVVWGSSEPYIESVVDEFAPNYTWSRKYTFDELNDKLIASGYKVGRLESVEIVSRNDTGSVDRIKFSGSSDSVTMTAVALKSVLGGSQLKSTCFVLDEEEIKYELSEGAVSVAASFEQSGAASDIYAVGAGGVKALPSSAYAVGKSGKVSKLSDDEFFVVSADGCSEVSRSEGIREKGGNSDADGRDLKEVSTRLPDNFFELQSVADGVICFNGFGYGHSVGMPQASAIAMAKAGYDYTDILKYYYSGIEIEAY